jgi:hypothetical protein
MIRRIALLGALVACASAASAQELTFAGIPWGTPADSVRARLRAARWKYRVTAPQGDLVFVGRDGSEADAYMHEGRLFRVVVIAGVPDQGLEARYGALADSLEAVLGAPIDRRPQLRVWEAGLTSASVGIIQDPATGERTLQMQWRGPGFMDAMDGREPIPEFRVLPAGFITVTAKPGVRVAVDTVGLRRLAGDGLHARFRVDFGTGDVRTDFGRYDAIEYEVEPDCVGTRVRVLSRTTFLDGQRERSDSVAAPVWVPVASGSHEEYGLDAVCRVAGRAPAAPARVRSFGPVPAGWVLISDDNYARRLLDATSITATGIGVYRATMRVEKGLVDRTVVGFADAMRLAVEVECGTGRMRISSMVGQLAGRDVGSVQVPPEMAGWFHEENSPVPLVLCRVVKERGL